MQVRDKYLILAQAGSEMGKRILDWDSPSQDIILFFLDLRSKLLEFEIVKCLKFLLLYGSFLGGDYPCFSWIGEV